MGTCRGAPLKVALIKLSTGFQFNMWHRQTRSRDTEAKTAIQGAWYPMESYLCLSGVAINS